MADLSDLKEDDSRDTDDVSNDDDENSTGAIPVPGSSSRYPSSDTLLWTNEDLRYAGGETVTVETSKKINNLPLIAEFTKDVKQVELDCFPNHSVAIKANSGENKILFKNVRIWFLFTIALLCTIAILLGATLPKMKKYHSNAPHTTMSPTTTPTISPSTSKTTSPLSTSPTNSPTSSPTSLTPMFIELVERLGPNVSNDIGVFKDAATPQFQAMYWLANNDTFIPDYMLSINSTKLDKIYLERYVAALLFYSMQINAWNRPLNFLSNSSICEWNYISASSSSATTDCCSSYVNGVACNDDLAIASLNLDGFVLNGTIPSEIGLLTSLKRIDFNHNYLNGKIPSEIGHLGQLTYLDLHWNSLSGMLPTELGQLTQLEYLVVYYNRLNGELPSECGRLHQLTLLDLSRNSLMGKLPSELGQLIHMQHLKMNNNRLIGVLPSESGLLHQLTYLNLYYNDLSGSLPSELGQWTELNYLNLGYNSLNGALPSESGLLRQLTILDLSYNYLSSTLPSELGRLTQLEALSLSYNSLSGALPSECGLLHHLIYLDLSENSLSGTLPSELGLLTQLTGLLYLRKNNFCGALPSELGLLSNLKSLDLSENRFNGTVPMELGGIEASRVDLNQNNFTGSLEEIFCGPNNPNWTPAENRNSDDATERLVVADCGDFTDDQTKVQCSCCYCCPEEEYICL